MEATSFGGSDVEGGPELGAQKVKQAIGKAPEKEESGNENDGENKLTNGQSGGTGEASVGDTFPVMLIHGLYVGGMSLLYHFIYVRLVLSTRHAGCRSTQIE